MQSPFAQAPAVDPLLLSNTTGSFAFRHPASWQFTNCENYGYAIGFGSQGGICPGESGGGFDMVVMSVSGDQRSAPKEHNYVWIGAVDKEVTAQVDGVDGTRISARVDRDPGMGPDAGTTQIMYDVYNGVRTYLVLYQHRPTQIDYSVQFDDVMQNSFWFEPWASYRSDVSGYTLDYPADWFVLSSRGGPDTEKYFANEKGIGSPIELDASGIFLAMSVVAGSCPNAPPGDVDNTAQVSANGRTVTRVSGFLGPAQSEAMWGSYASIPIGTDCYVFAFMFGSKATRDASLRTTDHILASFTTM